MPQSGSRTAAAGLEAAAWLDDSAVGLGDAALRFADATPWLGDAASRLRKCRRWARRSRRSRPVGRGCWRRNQRSKARSKRPRWPAGGGSNPCRSRSWPGSVNEGSAAELFRAGAAGREAMRGATGRGASAIGRAGWSPNAGAAVDSSGAARSKAAGITTSPLVDRKGLALALGDACAAGLVVSGAAAD